MSSPKPTIGVVIGDPSGVGPETVAKALKKIGITTARFVLIGEYEIFKEALDIVGWRDAKLVKISNVDEYVDSPNTLNIIDTGIVTDLSKFEIGKPSALAGKASYEALVKAVDLAMKGLVDVIFTAPIGKESLAMAGVKERSVTKFLEVKTGAKKARFLLIVDHLRIAHVTEHIPLKEVPKYIKQDEIYDVIKMVDETLKKYFGIENPKIAVAGLNPHAGEGGVLGDEEIKEISPAINKAREEGINVVGPIPADALFYRAYCLKEFDAEIVMYHDQGHIPAKIFGLKGYSISMGLPIVRITVAHGTAWDIAGKGIADETATINGLKLAIEVAKKIKGAIK